MTKLLRTLPGDQSSDEFGDESHPGDYDEEDAGNASHNNDEEEEEEKTLPLIHPRLSLVSYQERGLLIWIPDLEMAPVGSLLEHLLLRGLTQLVQLEILNTNRLQGLYSWHM